MADPASCAPGLTFLQPDPFGTDAFDSDPGVFAPVGAELVNITGVGDPGSSVTAYYVANPSGMKVRSSFTFKLSGSSSGGSSTMPILSFLAIIGYAGAPPINWNSAAAMGFGRFPFGGVNIYAAVGLFPGTSLGKQNNIAAVGELISGTMEYDVSALNMSGNYDLTYRFAIPGKGMLLTGTVVDRIAGANSVMVGAAPLWENPGPDTGFAFQSFSVVGAGLPNACPAGSGLMIPRFIPGM